MKNTLNRISMVTVLKGFTSFMSYCHLPSNKPQRKCVKYYKLTILTQIDEVSMYIHTGMYTTATVTCYVRFPSDSCVNYLIDRNAVPWRVTESIHNV
jgi:hypothetical protein